MAQGDFTVSFPSGVKVAGGKSLDPREGGANGYTDLADAKASVLSGERYLGLRVRVNNGSGGVDWYEWKDGILDDDLVISSNLDFDNGLNESSGVVGLGGSLVEDQTIITMSGDKSLIIAEATFSDLIFWMNNGENPSDNSIVLSAADSENDKEGIVSMSPISVSTQYSFDSGTSFARLLIEENDDEDAAVLRLQNRSTTFADRKEITIDGHLGTGIQVMDALDEIGLVGVADYSANYTSLSYVQKVFVEDSIAAAKTPTLQSLTVTSGNKTNSLTILPETEYLEITLQDDWNPSDIIISNIDRKEIIIRVYNEGNWVIDITDLGRVQFAQQTRDFIGVVPTVQFAQENGESGLTEIYCTTRNDVLIITGYEWMPAVYETSETFDNTFDSTFN